MVKNPPEGCQRIIPYLAYDNAPKAIEFLCSAFGFNARLVMPMGEGQIGHAELDLAGDCVMLASAQADMKFVGAAKLPARHSQIAVYVDDVDAHYARAVAAGAEIVEPLKTQFYGDRSYRALDCEGQFWTFATHVSDPTPEEIAKAMAEYGCG